MAFFAEQGFAVWHYKVGQEVETPYTESLPFTITKQVETKYTNYGLTPLYNVTVAYMNINVPIGSTKIDAFSNNTLICSVNIIKSWSPSQNPCFIVTLNDSTYIERPDCITCNVGYFPKTFNNTLINDFTTLSALGYFTNVTTIWHDVTDFAILESYLLTGLICSAIAFVAVWVFAYLYPHIRNLFKWMKK